MSRLRRERFEGQPPPIPREAQRRGRRTTPLIAIDEASLGPAMQACTVGERAFVYGKVHLGLTNPDAGKLAGYSDRSPHALEVQTSRLAHSERVQAAILEEGQKLMRTEGARSIKVLVQIRDDPAAENKDRIKCATELLNRSGFHAVTETHSHQYSHMSEGEKDARILALCAELGLSPDEAQKMLISPSDMQKNAEGVYELAPADPATDAAVEEAPAPRRSAPRRRKSTIIEATPEPVEPELSINDML